MAKKKTKRFQSNFTLSVVVLKWHHSSEGVKDGQRWEPYFSLMYYQSWGTKLQNNVLKPRLFSEERGERNKTVTEAKPGPQSSTSCHKQSSRDPPPPHLPPPSPHPSPHHPHPLPFPVPHGLELTETSVAESAVVCLPCGCCMACLDERA